MDDSLLYIIGGIIFLVVRFLMSGAKKKKQEPIDWGGKKAKQARPQTQPKQQQTIEDIFGDFMKDFEVKNAPPPVAPKPVQRQPKQDLDWQKVEHSKIVEKTQMIDHEDYHGVSHKIDPSHQSSKAAVVSEDEVIDFDTSEINWHHAIIAKEILDRKY